MLQEFIWFNYFIIHVQQLYFLSVAIVISKIPILMISNFHNNQILFNYSLDPWSFILVIFGVLYFSGVEEKGGYRVCHEDIIRRKPMSGG